MKHHKQWLLVADGKRAQAYHYDGPHTRPRPDPAFAFAHDDPPSREILSDKPGRMQPSVGNAATTFSPRNDAHEMAEAHFLDRVVEELVAAIAAGHCDRLILAAPPKALGHLRKVLPAAVQKTVIREIDKDLSNIPVEKLAKLIADAMMD
jgi:protein required for attachment to host cells